MKLCILNTKNICVNIIDADSEDPKFLAAGQTFAQDHSGEIGWSFADATWVAPEPELETVSETPEEVAARVRARRDVLLRASDWIVAKSYEAGEPVPEAWVSYRQALRDITAQEGFPYQVTWPAKP